MTWGYPPAAWEAIEVEADDMKVGDVSVDRPGREVWTNQALLGLLGWMIRLDGSEKSQGQATFGWLNPC